RTPVAGGRGGQDRRSASLRTVGHPHHEVPVVRLGRDHDGVSRDAEVAERSTCQIDRTGEVGVRAALTGEEPPPTPGVVGQFVEGTALPGDGIEGEDLAVGLELEDLTGTGDTGERGRATDGRQDTRNGGSAGRAKDVRVDQSAARRELGDGLLLAGEKS